MGCASSSLNDRDFRPPKRFDRRRKERRQSICIVGNHVAQRAYFSQERSKNRVRSWSPEEAESSFEEAVVILQNGGAWSVCEKDSARRVVHRKQISEALSDSGAYSDVGEGRGDAEGVVREEGEPERSQEGANLLRRSTQPFLPRPRLLGSPTKLCPEQERRLRCANLEVAPGLTELDSEFSDDEDDGFEFATVEASLASCDSEQGTPTPLFPGSLCSPNSDALTTDSSSFDNWERLQGSIISEPELEVLISTDYSLSDNDPSVAFTWSLVETPCNRPVLASGVEALPSVGRLNSPSSPGSLPSSQVSPCTPVLHTFPSDSVDQSFRGTSFSDDSFFSPSAEPTLPSGFFTGSTIYSTLGFSPSSLSSASFSESTIGHSPINDSFGDPLNESDRIEELSPGLSTLDWTTSIAYDNWNQLSPSVVKWHASSPSDSGVYNCDQPSRPESAFVDGSSHCETLIPGLPNDLAQLCLMRVPFIKYDPSYRMVCRQWRAVLSSEEFFKARKALGIQEAHISFVVHGNRVQIFSLQTYKWFCLPPLPRYNVNRSPGWKVPPEGGSSDGGFSPELQTSSDWGIDPYDWWQIDTVAVSDGTLFVIGGDQAEFYSFRKPSNPTNRVHKYDFCKNRWVAVSPMQVPRAHAAAVSLGKLIYVAGGREDTEEGASAEVYDFERNLWRVIPSMNTPMRMCVGMEHNGCFYVKGENAGPRYHVEGEIFSLVTGKWDIMSPGMRRGLERGPIASSNSNLFVADWADSLLKVYDPEQDSWLAVTTLPARISRLVGHSNILYGLTGKIKVDPYNHHVISDAPAGVWRLDLGKCLKNRLFGGKCLLGLDAGNKDAGQVVQIDSEQSQGLFGVGIESTFQREQESVFQTDLLYDFKNGVDCVWECLWWDPKQIVKTGCLAWVPCIAHCALFED